MKFNPFSFCNPFAFFANALETWQKPGVECEDDLTRELHTVVTLCNQCESNPLLLSPSELGTRYEDVQAAVERIILDAQKMPAGRRKGKAPGRFVTDSVRKRWAGKIGRVRREVMGKRVNFCARTVVTCDSSIGVDEIGVASLIHGPHHTDVI